MAWIFLQAPNVSGTYAKVCLTKDGSTPTATVAGTCDVNGKIYSGVGTTGYGAAEFDGAGVHTLKAISTLAGQTNSAVASATYTIVSSPALVSLVHDAPKKITSSSAGVNYYMPYLITTSNGRILLFYGAGAGAPDHGHTGMIQMKYSDDRGATWHDYAPSTVTRLVLSNIGGGYTTTPTCAIGAPTSGTTATCTAAAPVNGAVPSITLTNGGSGYDPSNIPFYAHPILCNVVGGGGTGAACQAWINDVGTHSISAVRMTSYGSGYTSTPSCSITQTGTPGNATCTFGAPVNGAVTSLTITNRGTGYTGVPNASITGNGTAAAAAATLNDCEPGDPANCFWHDSAYGQTETMGGGVSYNGTVILTTLDAELNWNSGRGPRVFRSLDNGATWEPSFNVLLASTQTHSPANMLSIPPSSSGVTGACAAGCLIQWTTEGGNGNANFVMYSYNDGITWTHLTPTSSVFPQSDEETAMAWAGGMNLIAYTRVGRSAQNNLGWPEPLVVRTSSDLGATWKFGLSNLPSGPCSVSPNSPFWVDQFTKPSGFINPSNPAQFTMVYGERLTCSAIEGGQFRWRTVTFDTSSTFSGLGQNTPLPQILDLAPGVIYGSGHTTYSGASPISAGAFLMAWEQAVSTSAEDIYVTTMYYPGYAPIKRISGGMMINCGLSIK
jgi:hypothetical protein